jgi:energy-coupling factor transporter transmembrane protein EcfT
MEQAFARIEELAAHVKEYVNNRVASVKLGAAEKSSKVVAAIIAAALVGGIFFFFLVFASIALAYALAEWTGRLYWGFLIVAGIYLLMGIIIWLAKERVLRLPIMNAMLRQLFKEETNDEED